MFKYIVFLVLLVALADARTKKHKIDESKSEINIIDEKSDSVTYEKVSISDPETEEQRIKEAEKEISAWIHNLNCSKATMGTMKCYMAKQVSNEYNSNPNRNPAKMKKTIKRFVEKLRANNKVDPELEILIQKYGWYLAED